MLLPILFLVASAAGSHAASGYQRTLSARRVVENVAAPLGLGVAAGPNLTSIVSVLDFGAVGDGVTDNTAAFTAALSSLPAGGIVFVPAGQYVFQGNITIPAAVSLVGVYTVVPSHNVLQHVYPTDGSILMPRGGRGNDSPDAPAFITVTMDGTLRGFTIYYPDQVPDAAPVPYPWTISMTGNNAAVMDVELLNPWNGINATHSCRHYIARVQGQPINIGVFIDQTYDIGRVENVHWNPWYSQNATYIAHQTVFGVGFIFARTDWEYVLNTFVFAMSIGYRFISSPEGSCNGNFVGIGADCCQNASVWVDSADPYGILVTNGEFTSFAGKFGPDVGEHTQVVVTNTTVGAVRFSNSAFWGQSKQIARMDGGKGSSLGFDQCIFNAWDILKENRSAIQVTGGDLLVRGCDFQLARPQVALLPGANKAIIAENLMTGIMNVTVDPSVKKAIVINNADDS